MNRSVSNCHLVYALGLFAAAGVGASPGCSARGAEGEAVDSSEPAGAGGDDVDGATSGDADDGFEPQTAAGTSSGGEACATATVEADLQPLTLFVLFDKSGSMEGDKWDDSTKALEQFVQDPASAGLRVALRFFPDDGCEKDTCDVDTCAEPLVDAGQLTPDPAPADGHEKTLVSAIENNDPDGEGTPIYAALAGAEQWAVDYAAAHPDEIVAVVLVTDGDPNGCNEDIGDIADLAGDAKNDGVLTYAVGLVGSNEGDMDEIAQEGGTQQGIFVSGSGAELLAAFKAIQGSSVPCEVALPEAQMGEPVDPTQVNVGYTPGGMGSSQTIAQVDGPSACTPTQGGWYYDDPQAPTTVVLCPSTCGAIQADPKAQLAIVLGCATVTAR